MEKKTTKGMNLLSPAQAKIFGIPEDLAKFVEIADHREFPGKRELVKGVEAGASMLLRDPDHCTVVTGEDASRHLTAVAMIRTIPDWRDFYIKHEIQKHVKGVATAEQIARLKRKPCVLDAFDGGIVYQIFGSLESPVGVRVIRRTFDYPREEVIPDSLVSRFFGVDGGAGQGGPRKIDHPNSPVFGELYEWMEATILSVFTVNGETFYSTRSKIDCARSKACQEVACPTMLEMFTEACQNHGISLEAFKQEGECHVFIMRHPWNQITNTGLEKACLIHHTSYSFGSEGDSLNRYCKNEYRKIERTFDGIPERVRLTREQAIEIIKAGGIVVEDQVVADGAAGPSSTAGSSANDIQSPNSSVPITTLCCRKLMSQKTALLWESLKLVSIAPVFEYFRLRTADFERSEEMMKVLNSYGKKKIEQYMAEEEVAQDKAVEYLYWRLMLKLNNPVQDKKYTLNKRIETAMKMAKVAYSEARDGAKSGGKGYEGEGGSNKNGKRKQKNKKFYWGGSAQSEELAQRVFFKNYLKGLREKDGGEYYCLVRDCRTLQRSEEARQRRLLENEEKGKEEMEEVAKEATEEKGDGDN